MPNTNKDIIGEPCKHKRIPFSCEACAIDSLKQQLADLKASLPKVRADAVNLLINEEMVVGRLRNDSMRSFIFVSDAKAFADKLEAGNE